MDEFGPHLAEPRVSQSTPGRAVALATLATGVGYVLTLIQQIAFAKTLGVSVETDALAAALAWGVGTSGPIGTALSSVALPVYVLALAARDKRRARDVSRAAAGIGMGLAALLMAITFVAADWLSTALAPGLGGTDRARLAGLLRLTAPLELLWVLVWLSTARANAHERYGLAAGSFALPPIPVILVFALVRAPSVEQVAIAYLVGAVLQVVVVLAAVGDLHEMRPSLRSPLISELGRRLVGAGAAFAILGVAGLALRSLASLQGPGAVATADYASRLVIAGEQVLLSGLLAVAFTRWSRAAAPPDAPSTLDRAPAARPSAGDDPWSVHGSTVRLAGGGIIIAFLVPIAAVPAITILFQGGRFDPGATLAVSDFLTWMSAGIAAHMLVLLAMRALLVAGRFMILLVIGLVAVLLMVVVAVLAMAAMRLNGVALGYSVGWVAAAWIAVMSVPIERTTFVSQVLRAAGSAALALAAALGVGVVLPVGAVLRPTIETAVFLLIVVVAGSVLRVAFVTDSIAAIGARTQGGRR